MHVVLDDQPAMVGEYNYSVFGERTLTAGADASLMGFASEQHDASGLIYLLYRYLDPAVGQFISVDPLVGSTLDPYGYADGNPLQVTDPLGLFSISDIGDAIYEDSANISAVFGMAATAAMFIPGAQVAAPFLGAASVVFAVAAAYKSVQEQDVEGAMTNSLGVVFGFIPQVNVARGGTQAAESTFSYISDQMSEASTWLTGWGLLKELGKGIC